MKVILLQNVPKLGPAYEVCDVAEGYARNHLIPNGKATPATKENLVWLEQVKEEKQAEMEKALQEAQQLASELDGYELTMSVNVGEKGELYEKITAEKIARQLQEEGFTAITADNIVLGTPIEEAGEYTVPVEFAHGLEAQLTVVISSAEE